MNDTAVPDPAPKLVSIEKAILADICLGLPLGKIMFSVPGHMDPGETPPALAPAPETFLFRGEQLAQMKTLYGKGDDRIVEAVEALAHSAEAAMQTGPFSVTDKPENRFSEDPHDYQSLAKYRWPNPETADGLPYVNRDGAINPACYSDDFDYVRLTRFSETVVLLSLAEYLTGRRDFGARAALLLETWFVDPATRQNPDFRFAQIAPGVEGDRWAGIIEARFFVYVSEAARLLAASGALSPVSTAAIQRWYEAFLAWLLESGQGKKAKKAKNNIGFWYDLQCMVYAHYCGKTELAETIARQDVRERLKAQMTPEGALPHELARAYPQDYVAFSVAAMALIARGGEQGGASLWDFHDSDGRNFQAAHDWLLKASNASALVATVKTAGAATDNFGGDLSLLFDTGLKLRAAQRLAEIEASAATMLRGKLAVAEELQKAAENALAKSRDKLARSEVQLAERRAEIDALRASASWRVTAPLRALRAALLRVLRKNPLAILRRRRVTAR